MATSTVSVQSNVAQTVRSLIDLGTKVHTQATVRSLNEIGAQLRTRASRQIRDAGYGLKAARIKKGLKVIKASPNKLTAIVRANGRPIRLAEFAARKAAAGGVSVNVLHGRKIVKKAFLAKQKDGAPGIFQRTGTGHKLVIKDGKVVRQGTPLKQLYGPSVPDALVNQVVMAELERLVAEKFDTILRRNIAYYASR